MESDFDVVNEWICRIEGHNWNGTDMFSAQRHFIYLFLPNHWSLNICYSVCPWIYSFNLRFWIKLLLKIQ